MSLHILDSSIYGNDFAGPRIRALFEEENVLQDWLDFEVALAEVQAGLGLVPEAAAREIKAKGTTAHVKLARVAEIYSQTMLSSVAMIRAFKEACADGAGEYLHLGATTQDIFDTTLARRLVRCLDIFSEDLATIRASLNRLADEHRHTLMPGITHGQQALPVSFGFVAAIWSDMLRKHQDRLAEARVRVGVGTVSGAVGNFASFRFLLGDAALEMERRVLIRFGLQAPPISVQPQIERWTEFLQVLALMSVSFEKIADEIFLFQRNEFSLLEEPFDTARQISSSTMPQKRNPNRCEMIKALAKKVRANCAGFSEVYMREMRDHTPFYMEDMVIPETALLASTILEQAKFVLAGLKVKADNMRRNLDLTEGALLTEALMLALAKKTGRKETGFALVHKAAMESFESSRPFADYAAGLAEIREHLKEEDIRAILDPANYIGFNDQLIDTVIRG